MRSKLGVTLVMLFMLGFPGVGLWLFWQDAHRRVESSATPFADRVLEDVLGPRGSKALDEAGTLELRKSHDAEDLAAATARLGPFRGTAPLRLVKSWAGERDETVWQFVSYTTQVRFANGTARVDMVVARRTLAPEWRVESFKVSER